jgi:hypothetical protein
MIHLKGDHSMNLDEVSDQNLNLLERLSRELLDAMRRAKLLDSPLAQALTQFEREAGDARRSRFDSKPGSEYRGY